MAEQDEAGAPPRRDRSRYLVQSLLHATEVLRAFRHGGEALRLRDVMERTHFSKGLCFRLLHTLHHCGFLERVEGNRYQLTAEIGRRRIPMIAIDIPHPGATYFGANNYEAGLLAGRFLGRFARQRWGGEVDEIVLVELARAGQLPHARLRGVMAGIREILHDAADCPCVTIDGDGQFKTALERGRKQLRESRAGRVLVGAANDPSALGAARAFQETGRAATSARGPERRAGRARRAARAAHAARGVGGLLPPSATAA
jgi:hypothetical protein